MDEEFRIFENIIATPQKYTCVQTRILLWIRTTDLTFKLTHITFNHGACSLHLDLEQLKDRTIKSSTMSQVLCSTIILEFLQIFQIKLRDSIVWHSQVSQNMWYLWILTKAIVMLCLFLPTTNAYVELIGVENSMKEHTCNAYIVKSNLRSKESLVIQSNQDVHVCGCIWWLT